MQFIALFLFLATISDVFQAAKILFTSVYDSASHINSMRPYFTRLAEEGHDVTVLDTSASAKPKDFGPKVKVVHIYITPEQRIPVFGNNTAKSMGIRQWTQDTSPIFMSAHHFAMDKAFGLFLDHHADTFNSVANDSWDLMIADEVFGVHQFALNTKLKRARGTPYIVFSTSMLLMTNYIINSFGRVGTARPGTFVLSPASSADFYDPTNFYLRLHGFAKDAVEFVGIRYVVENFGMSNIQHFGVNDFTWKEYMKGSSMFLTDHFDRFQFPVPEGTDFRGVGSHCPKKKVLTGEFLDFVEYPSSKGTILMAFGSYVKWDYAPEHVLKAVVESFAELTDYRIIFAYNGEKPLDVGSHVKITKWAPQSEILAHNKTLLFISHGGLKSMKEALCSFIPVIYMPLFAEQTLNAQIALELGIGGILNKYTVDKTKFLKEVRHVVANNARISNQIRKMHSIYMDRPMPSLDEAVFYTERVLRRTGRDIHFKRAGIDLSWREHFHLDSLVLLLGTLWMLSR